MPDERRAVDALDPTAYQDHLMRTAVLMAEMAKDMASVRKTLEGLAADHANTYRSVSQVEREFAVFKESVNAKMEGATKASAKLEDGLQYTRRTLFTAIAGAVVAFLFRYLAK